MDYLWILYLLMGFVAGLIGANIIWYSRVWGILHVSRREEENVLNYAIELTGPFEEVAKNKFIVLRTSHK